MQDWRKKVESQRGAVLAFETKNNKNKIAKWTAAALLAGADMIKLGYVSRASQRDNTNHVILATQVRAVAVNDCKQDVQVERKTSSSMLKVWVAGALFIGLAESGTQPQLPGNATATVGCDCGWNVTML
jgi:hypothetical protein